MVTKVDPFLIPIPAKLLADRETRNYFEYMNRFLHDLWQRTGGGSDTVDDNQLSEVFGSEQLEIKKVGIIELASGDTTITTTSDELVVCNNTADGTVTLNTTPKDGEDCIVSRRSGKITVNGAINGDTSMNIAIRYSSMHFKYSIAAGEWAVI
jgi:hypothetical protein